MCYFFRRDNPANICRCSLTEDHGGKFPFFVIPDKTNFKVNPDSLIRDHPGNFEKFDVRIPQDLKPLHYHEEPNTHLNNAGHQLYADFIESEIGEIF